VQHPAIHSCVLLVLILDGFSSLLLLPYISDDA
jgi:hypothetical protein